MKTYTACDLYERIDASFVESLSGKYVIVYLDNGKWCQGRGFASADCSEFKMPTSDGYFTLVTESKLADHVEGIDVFAAEI